VLTPHPFQQHIYTQDRAQRENLMYCQQNCNKMCLQLDLTSLGSLRLINHCFRTLVDSLPACKQTKKHAFNAIRALRDTKSISYHSLSKLHQALTSTQCHAWDDFGPFLFLINCERVCVNSIYRNKPLRFISRSDAETWFGFEPKHLENLPSLHKTQRAKPCNCHWQGRSGCPICQYPVGLNLVLVFEVEHIALSLYGTRENMEHRVKSLYMRRYTEHMNALAGFPPLQSTFCPRPLSKSRLRRSTLRIKFYESVGSISWHGFYCNSCFGWEDWRGH
jgi:hypothetical protein